LKQITQGEFDSIVESKLESFINEWCIDEDDYEELLNETCEEVNIGSLTYQAGQVLREVDPIAFRCGCADEEISDNEIDEARDEIITELEAEYKII